MSSCKLFRNSKISHHAQAAISLTADRIQWSLGATIGRKFSKQFALNKQAQRVDYTEGQEPAVPSGDDNTQTGAGGGNNNPPSGELEG